MEERWERIATLTGAGFTAFYFIGFGLIGEVSETSTPSPTEIADLFAANPTRTLVGAYLSLLSLVFLLWFVGSLRSSLRLAESGSGRLSAIAFGGGVSVTAVLAVGFALVGGAAFRADSVEGLNPETGLVFYDVYRAMVGMAAPVGFAVLIGATAVVGFRTKKLPGWLSWLSVIIAFGLMTPAGFFFVFFALAWVFMTSIWLFVAARPSTDHKPAPPPDHHPA